MTWRIRDRATFVELRRRGRRASYGPVRVVWLPGVGTEPPRVAFALSRAVGSAVTRNRLRRRLRAVVRQLRPPLAPGAYLLSAGAPAAVLSFDQLRTAVAEAIAGLPVQR